MALLFILRPLNAVVINSASGNGNISAPPDDPGWANVGFLGGATGTYIGWGWVLTAAHVGPGSITLNGLSYEEEPGTALQLTNNTPGKSLLTDLVIYRLKSTPEGISPLTLATTTPTTGSSVTMIGAGRNRGNFTEWSVNTSTNPWTWTEVSSGGSAAGYQTLETRSMRWGTNSISSSNFWVSDSSVDTRSFSTTFEITAGSDESQPVIGDSGGAVFSKTGSSWVLSGLIVGVGGYSGQPSAATTPVYGNAAYLADISSYAPQIMAVIPEPYAYSLFIISAIWGLFVTFRRKRSRRARVSCSAEESGIGL